MTLEQRKSTFFVETTAYLGYVIRPGCLELAKRIIDALAKFGNTTTQTELRPFLGLFNFFRQFGLSCVRLDAYLNKNLRNEKTKTFGYFHEKKSRAVASVKNAPINPLVLALSRTKGLYTLGTHVCHKEISSKSLRK